MGKFTSETTAADNVGVPVELYGCESWHNCLHISRQKNPAAIVGFNLQKADAMHISNTGCRNYILKCPELMNRTFNPHREVFCFKKNWSEGLVTL